MQRSQILAISDLSVSLIGLLERQVFQYRYKTFEFWP